MHIDTCIHIHTCTHSYTHTLNDARPQNCCSAVGTLDCLVHYSDVMICQRKIYSAVVGLQDPAMRLRLFPWKSSDKCKCNLLCPNKGVRVGEARMVNLCHYSKIKDLSQGMPDANWAAQNTALTFRGQWDWVVLAPVSQVPAAGSPWLACVVSHSLPSVSPSSQASSSASLCQNYQRLLTWNVLSATWERPMLNPFFFFLNSASSNGKKNI